MGTVIWFRDHVPASVRSGCNEASTSKVMWPQDFSPAKRTIAGQRLAGIKRRPRQVLTVDNGKSSAAATAPVPPKSLMTASTSIDANIVRNPRTSQGFATCETTISSGNVPIAPVMGIFDNDQERALATRWLVDIAVQQDFAKAIGVAKNTWNGVEKGSRRITLGMARKIKKKYQMGLDWTLDGEISDLPLKYQRKIRTYRPSAA